MTRQIVQWLMACSALVLAMPGWAAQEEFQFGVIVPSFADPLDDDSRLREALAETGEENLAFVVVNGIKSPAEPCSDRLYEQRKALFENAKHGVIVSVAASDWSDCRYSNGRTAALERLNRVRELFFANEFSLGASKVPVVRQSANVKFRDYSKNTRWEMGGIMFATLHLPSNNNRYLTAAGRNGEFEDRLIANRDWLQRIGTHTARNKSLGIVIFCDGSPLSEPNAARAKRDGFAEVRQQLNSLAAKFTGKILIVHNRVAPAGTTQHPINWRGNLGDLTLSSRWLRVTVNPAQTALFGVDDERNNERPK